MPALPLGDAGAYVAAAYITFMVLLVVYVSVMARNVTRVRQELRRLTEEREREESR